MIICQADGLLCKRSLEVVSRAGKGRPTLRAGFDCEGAPTSLLLGLRGPVGKQLTLQTGGRWEIVVIKLEDAPYWLTKPASEVVEAGRIARWHMALAGLRERDFMTMTASAERRMLRILAGPGD